MNSEEPKPPDTGDVTPKPIVLDRLTNVVTIDSGDVIPLTSDNEKTLLEKFTGDFGKLLQRKSGDSLETKEVIPTADVIQQMDKIFDGIAEEGKKAFPDKTETMMELVELYRVGHTSGRNFCPAELRTDLDVLPLECLHESFTTPEGRVPPASEVDKWIWNLLIPKFSRLMENIKIKLQPSLELPIESRTLTKKQVVRGIQSFGAVVKDGLNGNPIATGKDYTASVNGDILGTVSFVVKECPEPIRSSKDLDPLRRCRDIYKTASAQSASGFESYRIAVWLRELDTYIKTLEKQIGEPEKEKKTQMTKKELDDIHAEYVCRNPERSYPARAGVSFEQENQLFAAVSAFREDLIQLRAALSDPIADWGILERYVDDAYDIQRRNMEPVYQYLTEQDAEDVRERTLSSGAYLLAKARKEFALPGMPPQKTVLTRDELWALFEEEWRFNAVDSRKRLLQPDPDETFDLPDDSLKFMKERLYSIFPDQVEKTNALAVLDSCFGSVDTASLSPVRAIAANVMKSAWEGLKQRVSEEFGLGTSNDDDETEETFGLEGEGPFLRDKLKMALLVQTSVMKREIGGGDSWPKVLTDNLERCCPENIEKFSDISHFAHWLMGNGEGVIIPCQRTGRWKGINQIEKYYSPVFERVGMRFDTPNFRLDSENLHAIISSLVGVIPLQEVEGRLMSFLSKDHMRRLIEKASKNQSNRIRNELRVHFEAVREATPFFLRKWFPTGIRSKDELCMIEGYLWGACSIADSCFMKNEKPAFTEFRNTIMQGRWKPVSDDMIQKLLVSRFVEGSSSKEPSVQERRQKDALKLLEGTGPFNFSVLHSALMTALPDARKGDIGTSLLQTEISAIGAFGSEEVTPEKLRAFLLGFCSFHATEIALRNRENPTTVGALQDSAIHILIPILHRASERLGIQETCEMNPAFLRAMVRPGNVMRPETAMALLRSRLNKDALQGDIRHASRSGAGRVMPEVQHGFEEAIDRMHQVFPVVLQEWMPEGIGSLAECNFLAVCLTNYLKYALQQSAGDNESLMQKGESLFKRLHPHLVQFKDTLRNHVQSVAPITMRSEFDAAFIKASDPGILDDQSLEAFTDLMSTDEGTTLADEYAAFVSSNRACFEPIGDFPSKEKCATFATDFRTAAQPFIDALSQKNHVLGKKFEDGCTAILKSLHESMPDFFPPVDPL